MPTHPEYVTRSIDNAFRGHQAHPAPAAVLRGLDAATAGAEAAGMPHTIFQLVDHVRFWQDLGIEWIRSKTPPAEVDGDADWSGFAQPASDAEWQEAVDRFLQGLGTLHDIADSMDLDAPIPGWGETTRLEILQTIATHNSFHLGQVVMLRRLLGDWQEQAPKTE